MDLFVLMGPVVVRRRGSDPEEQVFTEGHCWPVPDGPGHLRCLLLLQDIWFSGMELAIGGSGVAIVISSGPTSVTAQLLDVASTCLAFDFSSVSGLF